MFAALRHQASSDNPELVTPETWYSFQHFFSSLYISDFEKELINQKICLIFCDFLYLKEAPVDSLPQLSYKVFTKQVVTNCIVAEPSVFRWVKHILFLLKLRFPSCGAAQSCVAVSTDMFWLAALPFLAAAVSTAWKSSPRQHNKLQSVLYRLMSVRYSWSVLGAYVSSI